MPKSRGGATIGDSLSSSMKARLKRLREDLDRKAKASIDAQLSRPKPPWSGDVKKASLKQQVRTKSPSQTALSLGQYAPTQIWVEQWATRACARTRQSGSPAHSSAVKTSTHETHSTFGTYHRKRQLVEGQYRCRMRIAASSTTPMRKSQTARQSGEILYVILGLDFGTSSTKVIARFPYEPGVPTVAIPSPAFCEAVAMPICGRLSCGCASQAASWLGRSVARDCFTH